MFTVLLLILHGIVVVGCYHLVCVLAEESPGESKESLLKLFQMSLLVLAGVIGADILFFHGIVTLAGMLVVAVVVSLSLQWRRHRQSRKKPR